MINKKNLLFLFGFASFSLFLTSEYSIAEIVNVHDSMEIEREEGEFIPSDEADIREETILKERVIDEEIVNSLESCINSYQENQECPEDICTLQCSRQINSRMCVLECLPKQCINIKPEDCPRDICKVLTGCNDKDICYPKDTQEPPECGSLAYGGDDTECCDGFVKRCGIEFFDGTCDMEGSGSLDSVPICIPCGNGICNQFENRCNCPEDCLNDTDMLELLRAIKVRSDARGVKEKQKPATSK